MIRARSWRASGRTGTMTRDAHRSMDAVKVIVFPQRCDPDVDLARCVLPAMCGLDDSEEFLVVARLGGRMAILHRKVFVPPDRAAPIPAKYRSINLLSAGPHVVTPAGADPSASVDMWATAPDEPEMLHRRDVDLVPRASCLRRTASRSEGLECTRTKPTAAEPRQSREHASRQARGGSVRVECRWGRRRESNPLCPLREVAARPSSCGGCWDGSVNYDMSWSPPPSQYKCSVRRALEQPWWAASGRRPPPGSTPAHTTPSGPSSRRCRSPTPAAALQDRHPCALDVVALDAQRAAEELRRRVARRDVDHAAHRLRSVGLERR